MNNAFFSAILRKKYSKCLLFFKKTVLNFPYMKQYAYAVLSEENDGVFKTRGNKCNKNTAKQAKACDAKL